MTNLFFKL